MVKQSLYTPSRGDLIWLDFNPQAGHEQMGRRPALILSPIEYNQKTGLALMCPVTSSVKGYPFEVIISSKMIKGAILSDQVKCLDWKERQAILIEKVDGSVLTEVLSKLNLLLNP